MSLRNKLAIVGLSGVLFTGAAVGLSGIASAQGPEVKAEEPGAPAASDGAENMAVEIDGDHLGMVEDFEISAEDEAVFERYDQCLVDNGFDESLFEAELDENFELDEDAAVAVEAFEIDEELEAAFAACDPILDDLSDDLFMMDDLGDAECWVGSAEAGDIADFELTPEEEAMFEALADGEVITFDAIVGEDGELQILEGDELPEGDWTEEDWTEEDWAEGDWTEEDWAEAEELLGDDDAMIEMFEISPEDELFLDGLGDFEGCEGVVAFSLDGEAFDGLELDEVTEGEVEPAGLDA